jgi:hypothetical protein
MRYEKGQIIGLGGEKRVFEDSKDSKKAIAEYRRGEFKKNANQIKGQYYFGKILKMLYPKNVPDIHAAGKAEKDFLLLEKVELDPDHKFIQETLIAEAEGKKLPPKIFERRGKAGNNIEKKYNRRISKLRDKFTEAGIPVDTSHPLNFASGADNSLVYLDNALPWNLDRHHRQIYWNIDIQKLERAIGRLPENFRGKAENLYARMAQLYEEDKKSLRTTK